MTYAHPIPLILFVATCAALGLLSLHFFPAIWADKVEVPPAHPATRGEAWFIGSAWHRQLWADVHSAGGWDGFEPDFAADLASGAVARCQLAAGEGGDWVARELRTEGGVVWKGVYLATVDDAVDAARQGGPAPSSAELGITAARRADAALGHFLDHCERQRNVS